MRSLEQPGKSAAHTMSNIYPEKTVFMTLRFSFRCLASAADESLLKAGWNVSRTSAAYSCAHIHSSSRPLPKQRCHGTITSFYGAGRRTSTGKEASQIDSLNVS